MELNLQNVSLVLSLPVAATCLAYMVRTVRMLSRLELKMEMLWEDYTERKKADDEFRQKMLDRRLLPRQQT